MKVNLHQKPITQVSKSLIAVFLMLNVINGYSQDFTVRGTVTAEDGESIPGANVTVKNTSIGTVTDLAGNYKINIPDGNQTLVVSFIEYVSQEIPINGRSEIDIVLEPDVQALEEVVVIGYGTVQKSDLTGSVGRVEMEDLIKAP